VIHGTFRLIPHEAAGAAANSTNAVMLEPLGMPGMVVTEKLTVSADKSSAALFNVVPGLDGAPDSVSLELGSRPAGWGASWPPATVARSM
jgi:hypothetical protein